MSTAALQQKFQTLVDEHRGILFKVSASYCRDADDREDLAQEIIAQLWRSFPSFDGRCLFSTWMYRVALNVAISFVRRERTRKRQVIPADGRVLEVIDETQQAPQPLADVGPLYGFIERLDPLNKALILLYLDDKSHAEIAQVLGISTSNVGTKISRLKANMKKELAATAQQE